MSKKNHLPLYGVGPIIIYGQFVFTAISIILTYKFDSKFATINVLNILFKVMGILLISSGLYLDLSAKLKSKLFKSVEDNKLITDGVYSIVRNPVYSGALLACTGVVLIANNLILLIVPVICWLYMTLFLIKTEEKWLKELYGQEYVLYCKKVNRCIPWFPKKK
ncbi:MAG: isoprenylcysteine carboxylmethyltransferase family protein [Lachnospiraceae bacterium]|nr:isoprenylcysteine carboxylmethyltransferase family protein [Lachnospiraceae bacterium]MDE6252928.1 isoprenylcysteine carboxylmethyltransferase family protein [Lachnospiraceae bacterium]